MEGTQTKQSTEKLLHRMLMLQEASPGQPMTMLKFLALIRGCGAI